MDDLHFVFKVSGSLILLALALYGAVISISALLSLAFAAVRGRKQASQEQAK